MSVNLAASFSCLRNVRLYFLVHTLHDDCPPVGMLSALDRDKLGCSLLDSFHLSSLLSKFVLTSTASVLIVKA